MLDHTDNFAIFIPVASVKAPPNPMIDWYFTDESMRNSVTVKIFQKKK